MSRRLQLQPVISTPARMSLVIVVLLAGCRPTSEALREEGFYLMVNGDLDGAIDKLTEAIERDPRNTEAYFWRGKAQERKGDYKGALSDYSEAIRIGTDEPAVYANRAWNLATAPDASLRDGRQALEDAVRACKMEGSTWHWAGVLAAAHAELGHYRWAATLQEKYIKTSEVYATDHQFEILDRYRLGKPWRARSD